MTGVTFSPSMTPNLPCRTSNRLMLAGYASISFNNSDRRKLTPPSPMLCASLPLTLGKASKIANVVFEYLNANQGPVKGSWLTPSLISCRNFITRSSLPGLASSKMKYAFRPGVLSCPFRRKPGWDGSSLDQLGESVGKGAILVEPEIASTVWAGSGEVIAAVCHRLYPFLARYSSKGICNRSALRTEWTARYALVFIYVWLVVPSSAKKSAEDIMLDKRATFYQIPPSTESVGVVRGYCGSQCR